MRYRILDADGDYTVGHGGQNFYVNDREAVGQAVLTRLKLFLQEWFLDQTEGTPWATQILGEQTLPTYDLAIRDRITGTQGVTKITSYSSNLNTVTRALTVNASIDTIYGDIQFEAIL
jgi:hypothetical protein